jgi:hypothetical protein
MVKLAKIYGLNYNRFFGSAKRLAFKPEPDQNLEPGKDYLKAPATALQNRSRALPLRAGNGYENAGQAIMDKSVHATKTNLHFHLQTPTSPYTTGRNSYYFFDPVFALLS